MSARPEVFGLLNFPRPVSIDALSPAQADAALVAQLRRENAQIENLIADVRAQANIIRDIEAEHTMRLVVTFEESETIVTLSRVVAALVNSGHEVVMKFELVADRRALNVYVKDEA